MKMNMVRTGLLRPRLRALALLKDHQGPLFLADRRVILDPRQVFFLQTFFFTFSSPSFS